MSINDNIYNFRNRNVRLHVSNFVRDIISPFEKKYGKNDQLLDNIIIHRKTNDNKNTTKGEIEG